MSSDLLKEFGSLEGNPWVGAVSQSTGDKATADDDDFGDFEDPEIKQSITHTQSFSSPSSAIRFPAGSEGGGAQTVSTDEGYLQPYIHSSTLVVQDAPGNDDDWGDFSQHSVIFDADLEATKLEKEVKRTIVDQREPKELTKILANALTPAASIPATTTIGASDSQGSKKFTEPRRQSSKNAPKYRVKATNPTTIKQPTIDDEPWVDFEAAEAAEAATSPRTFKEMEPSNLGPPPSNIPPPSILLPLIAKIFGHLAANLKAITSHQPLDQPGALTQLRALLATIRAAARILAGRKLRWKRDIHLSQSMKIGPARSGKAGGMKLAGVDKAESRREDQEAAEALQVWKQQAGPLRSTTVALNSHLPEHERFKIFEIAENMPIRQGRPNEGIVTAPKCCFLCGIKRDERVTNVDVDVEDSFGEWWVEHWGHFDCVNFWENHRDLLQQR